MERTYPERCAETVERLAGKLGVDPEEAWAMMLLMATLMDLRPEDGKVAEMILRDMGPAAA